MKVIYDGAISGAAIVSALKSTVSGSVVIPYANGMRVLIIDDDSCD